MPIVEEAPPIDPQQITLDDVSDRTLVTIELGYGLVQLIDDRRGSPLVTRITGVRKQLSQVFGFVVPQFRVRDALDLPPNDYRILLGGVPLGRATIRADKVLAIDAGDSRDLAGQIGGQFGDPRTWLPVAGILGAIGLIPAMPQTIFLPAAGLAGWLWWALKQRGSR